jgi:penicillin amidase
VGALPAIPTSGALAQADGAPGFAPNANFDLGSNSWVIGGVKSATGGPLLANDPHREILNPSLRNLVHLVAPGWNVIGMTEPGMPGVLVGHNEDVAWGFTILGVDQQDLYVEETDPADPNRYLYNGQWRTMSVERELIQVQGKRGQPEVFENKATIHGPVIYEHKERHRAYTLRWVGAEAGGAGYLGSLNVLQAKNWNEFTAGVAKSWYLPSHSLVYADTKGNYGYVAAALSPIRRNWDGLLPVPGKDGQYEWEGFVPLTELPRELNRPAGYYATANNDVVPKFSPATARPSATSTRRPSGSTGSPRCSIRTRNSASPTCSACRATPCRCPRGSSCRC